MKTTVSIQGGQIKNLITKFFHREKNLRFQILLDLGQTSMIGYKEYTDYSKYKEDYKMLKNSKSENLDVLLDENNLPFANSSTC